MIPVADALAKIARLDALGIERVALAEALHRVLGGTVRARGDWPPFETSAMDGYAVRVEDASPPGAVLTERPTRVAAGDAPPDPIRPGEAVRIMTGAPLPANATAIVPVEDSIRETGRVRFREAPRAGAHVRHRGESVSAGSTLAVSGRRLTATDIALLALAGSDPVAVHRRPRVAVVATGNEIVPVSGDPGPGQLRDSNGPMLASLCLERGLRPVRIDRVRDDAESVARLFSEGFADADVLLTTGGVSAGDLDLLPAAAEGAGFELLFHGVSLRPGKPIVLGRRGGHLWLGLPGNPVSAAVTFHLFGRELLGRLEGDDHAAAPRVSARLSRALPATPARETYRDAIWQVVDGESRVAPIRSAGSHDLGAYARANALVRIPAGTGPLEEGALVECILIGGGGADGASWAPGRP